MVAVISVDAYPFLAFSNLNCHSENTGENIGVVLVAGRCNNKSTQIFIVIQSSSSHEVILNTR